MLSKLIDGLTRHYKWTLAAILGLFSGLVLGNMTRWSIWFDEAFSAYLIRFDWAEIVKYTAADVHPPLYYWLLKSWTTVFGVSELGVRSLSLLFAILAIIGVFVLIRRLFASPSMALLASLAVALSPMVVRFAHEARMYTLVLAIVVWATYALVQATASGQRRWWLIYALLVAAGMWTHYFVAFAWLAHWVWRASEKRSGRLAQFWTKSWLYSHGLAIVLFLPWLVPAVKQVASVQSGFWVPPVSAYTLVDYLSNAALYRQYGTVLGWWAVVLVVAVVAGSWLIVKTRQHLAKRYRSELALLTSLALTPPLLLVLVSMPPLSSTFIDRYIIYAQVFLVVLLALAAAVGFRRKVRGTVLAASLIGLVMVAGIGNVYYYGNYNKNSRTSIRVKEVVQAIHEVGRSGQPIIAATPWIYYETAFYDSKDHHVYFLDSSTKYKFGSEAMLRDNPTGKIKQLDKFTTTYRYVWYLGASSKSEIEPPVSTWQRLESVAAYDYINDSTVYRASLFDTRPNQPVDDKIEPLAKRPIQLPTLN